MGNVIFVKRFKRGKGEWGREDEKLSIQFQQSCCAVAEKKNRTHPPPPTPPPPSPLVPLFSIIPKKGDAQRGGEIEVSTKE